MKPNERAKGINGKRTFTLKYAKECVGPGWSGLIEKIWERLPHDALVEQVKEKFGTLRFYVAYVDKEMLDFIAEVEEESAKTCERCGKPGSIHTNFHYMLTLCDECETKRIEERRRR